MKRSAPAALPVLFALIGLVAALAWRVAPHLGDPGLVRSGLAAEPAGARDAASEPAEPGLDAPEMPSAAAFAVIAGRNLFAPERKPLPAGPPVAPAAAPARAAPPDLVLMGVLLAADGGVAVVQRRRARGETLRLRLGELHEGWRLSDLTARSATFTQGGEAVTLSLNFAADR